MSGLRYSFFFALLLTIFFSGAEFTSAAILAPVPEGETIAPGDLVSVPILLDSEGENINVVSAEILYSTQYLELVSISRGGSILTLWVEEPKHDSTAGRVIFSGGLPNGTVASNAPVVILTFRARAVGLADIHLTEASMVLLSDGTGTPAAITTKAAVVPITQSSLLSPRIQSPTHPEEWIWYPNNNVEIQWAIIQGAFYSYLLSRDAHAEADDHQEEENNGFINYPSLADGIWYFSLRERLPGEEWGSPQRRAFLIDVSPPILSPVTVEEIEGGKHLVSFSAQDSVSGIEKTEARILRHPFSWFPVGFTGTWKDVHDVLVLEDISRVGRIEIRARDFSGNIATVHYTNPNIQFTQRLLLATLGTVVLVLFVCIVGPWTMRRKGRM